MDILSDDYDNNNDKENNNYKDNNSKDYHKNYEQNQNYDEENDDKDNHCIEDYTNCFLGVNIEIFYVKWILVDLIFGQINIWTKS